jgi:hypothetical protein
VIIRLTNVPAPPPLTRYFKVNVLLPGVRPVTKNMLLSVLVAVPTETAVASAAARVVAPEMANDMYEVFRNVPVIVPVIQTTA